MGSVVQKSWRTVVALSIGVAALLHSQPAQAQAGHKLRIYTVKEPLKIASGLTHQAIVSCKGGDHALSGTWDVSKITDGGDLREIDVRASHGLPGTSAGEDGAWYFKLFNPTAGAAKVTLYVTCLAQATKGGDHDHGFILSDLNLETSSVPPGAWEGDLTTQCTDGTIAVAVGFSVDSGAARIFRSYPSANLLTYHSAFTVQTTASISLSHRCLQVATTTVNDHNHDIVFAQVPSFGGSLRQIPAGDPLTEAIGCDYNQLSAVPFWWIDDPYHVSFLGSGGKLDERWFRFQFDGGGAPGAYLSHHCFDKVLGPPVPQSPS